MPAHLLIMYPRPDDVLAFDRAYETEHIPLAAPLLKGARLTTKRVVGPSPAARYHLISDIEFPSLEALQSFTDSHEGQNALVHAASITKIGTPTVVVTVTDDGGEQ